MFESWNPLRHKNSSIGLCHGWGKACLAIVEKGCAYGALLAARSNPSLKAAFGLAPWSSDKNFAAVTRIPRLLQGSRMSIGVIFALLGVLGLWVFLFRTRSGFSTSSATPPK